MKKTIQILRTVPFVRMTWIFWNSGVGIGELFVFNLFLWSICNLLESCLIPFFFKFVFRNMTTDILTSQGTYINEIKCEILYFLRLCWNWTLNVLGWEELKGIAVRYHRNFPNILENTYNRSKFLFYHTNKKRTGDSFKAFVEGGNNSSLLLTLWKWYSICWFQVYLVQRLINLSMLFQRTVYF